MCNANQAVTDWVSRPTPGGYLAEVSEPAPTEPLDVADYQNSAIDEPVKLLVADEHAVFIVRLPAGIQERREARARIILVGWQLGIALHTVYGRGLLTVHRRWLRCRIEPSVTRQVWNVAEMVGLLLAIGHIELLLDLYDPTAADVLETITRRLPAGTHAELPTPTCIRLTFTELGDRHPEGTGPDSAPNGWSAQDQLPDI